MEIRIDTKIAGVPFGQVIRITGQLLNELDQDLIQEKVNREILKAERDLMSMIVMEGVRALSDRNN